MAELISSTLTIGGQSVHRDCEAANLLDSVLMQLSSGLYPLKEFPAVIGKEVAGIVVALPTDLAVLNDETFKKNNFAVGRKVAAVSLRIWIRACLGLLSLM
jgi:NADPH:quinone reductase-like Zn-dependent oxidoreductase